MLSALLGAVALVATLIAAAGLDLDDGHAAYANRRRDRPDTLVTISRQTIGRPIPSGFVGLSLEYPAVPWYAGRDPNAVNPVFEQLIRNLAPGQSPVLRIGGNSSDTTWWPTPGIRRPPGVSYTLTGRWLATTGKLAHDLRARMIMGIDLEAGVPGLAIAEARAFVAQFGPRALRGFEIGNEAPRYGLFPWYHRGPGQPVLARPRSYGFDQFDREFATVARRLPRAVPTAGPTLGGPSWMGNLQRFITTAPRLGLVTYHTYPFNRCFTPRSSRAYPTVPRLLSPLGSREFDPAVTGYAAIAHRYGLPFRVDELNSVACGGKRGVSDTFASALWAVDSLFEMARIGVSGVNFHMFPGASYILFRFRRRNGRWVASIRPEYYGLLLFAQAAPPASRLLRTTTRGGAAIRAWATRTADGTVRVVLINDDLYKRHVFLLKAPAGHAGVIRLTAPSAYAKTGVSLGEQRFGATSTGRLSAPPEQQPLTSSRGRYVVRLGPASAALLTIPAH